jgi:TolB-like protein
MKKRLFVTGVLACMLVFGAETAHAQTLVTLDGAIRGAVEEFSYTLRRGSRIVILSMRAGSGRMSNHIIEEMASVIVNQRVFTVVEPAGQEMNFRTSGEVSDTSAQEIGRNLGAQYIVTGSLEPIGEYSRFRVRVIEVETAVIQLTYSANVQNDQVVTSLLGSGGAHISASSSAASVVPAASGGYKDFTTGERWGTWALNFFTLPGLGSYVIMRDTVGGTVQVVLFGLGIACTIIGEVVYVNASYSTLEFLPVGGGRIFLFPNTRYNVTAQNIGGGFALTGLAMFVAGGIYNIVRSSTYHKPRPQTASIVDPEAWNIAVLPGKNGIEQVSLSYTLRF